MGYFTDPNITRPYELLEYANTTTEGAFGVTVIMCVAIITFIALQKDGWRPAFMASAFLTGITTIILRLVNAVNDGVVLLTLVAIVGSLATMWWRDR